MFFTNEHQSKINAFARVRVPRARDLFRKLGECKPSDDAFSGTVDAAADAQRPFVSMADYAAWVQSEAKRLRDSEASPHATQVEAKKEAKPPK